MENSNKKTLLWTQMGIDIALAVGFLIGILVVFSTLGFGGFFAMLWLLPLSIASLVLSIISKNTTLPYTISNVVITVLVWIPFLNFILVIAGLALSIVSAVTVGNAAGKLEAKSGNVVDAEATNVEPKHKKVTHEQE